MRAQVYVRTFRAPLHGIAGADLIATLFDICNSPFIGLWSAIYAAPT